MSVNVYSYVDTSRQRHYLDSVGDFNFTGTWSGDGVYAAATKDVVQYGPALYICLRDNTGDNPLRPPTELSPASWSILTRLHGTLPVGPVPDSLSLRASDGRVYQFRLVVDEGSVVADIDQIGSDV